ncbi:MAG: hypothetical protein ACLPI9_00725 [Halobacteriota archaeon]
MRIWIEVASGDRAWVKKIHGDASGNKRGLKAPASTRYVNILKDVRRGDIILSYLTTELTKTPGWASSIVGISTAASRCYREGHTLLVDTTDDLELPVPIRYAEFRESETRSDGFKNMVSRNMQKYLFEITRDDLRYLVGLHKYNADFLRRSKYFEVISRPESEKIPPAGEHFRRA